MVLAGPEMELSHSDFYETSFVLSNVTKSRWSLPQGIICGLVTVMLVVIKENQYFVHAKISMCTADKA